MFNYALQAIPFLMSTSIVGNKLLSHVHEHNAQGGTFKGDSQEFQASKSWPPEQVHIFSWILTYWMRIYGFQYRHSAWTKSKGQHHPSNTQWQLAWILPFDILNFPPVISQSLALSWLQVTAEQWIVFILSSLTLLSMNLIPHKRSIREYLSS